MKPLVGYELSVSGPVHLFWGNEDGSRHWESRVPRDDISDLPKDLQDIINDHWTPDLLEAWDETQGAIVPTELDITFLINSERDRRVETGFTFGGKEYQLDPTSERRIIAMGADARFAKAGGVPNGNLRWATPDADFTWTATDNEEIPMDAQTMINFSTAAKIWVIRHQKAARAIKGMSPIPSDWKSDVYWP